jgi:CubicO group peptidase (beta-lactamase class C family)
MGGQVMTKDRVKMLATVLSILVISAALLFALAPHPPGVPEGMSSISDLEDYLRCLVDSGNPPGMSIVVVKHGAPVYLRGFGLADGPRGMPATPDTVYHWWSMTKIVTAVAILQLQDRGRLILDDPVSLHLPWFKVDYGSFPVAPIRIEHLLRHTSGLPDMMPDMIGWVHYQESVLDQTALAKSRLPEFNKLRFQPGERAAYSNLNYLLLGAVIEAVSGQAHERYVQAHILEPLGMTQTGFVVSRLMRVDEAAGSLLLGHYYSALLPWLLDPGRLIRERQGKLLWFNRVYIDVTPSTGLIGPATDVAKLLDFFLDNGERDEIRLLSPKATQMLLRPRAIDGRGLGWAIGADEAGAYLEHPGGGPGFATIMRIYPQKALGIAILANGTDLERDRLATAIAKLDWLGASPLTVGNPMKCGSLQS